MMTAFWKTARFVLPLWLALAGSAVCFAADVPTPDTSVGDVPAYDLPDAADSGSDPSWLLADLDGDNSFDLAVTQSSLADDGGYEHAVVVDLGDSRKTTFQFQSHRASIALHSRDVDGDHDRDIVIVEPFSKEPIAVWINDGSGGFHQGDLADFGRLFHQTNTALVAPDKSDSPIFITDDESPFLTHLAEAAPYHGMERLEPRRAFSRPLLLSSDTRSRAPPLFS